MQKPDTVHLCLSFKGDLSEVVFCCGKVDGHWSVTETNCKECLERVKDLAEFASKMCGREWGEEDCDALDEYVGAIGLKNGIF